MIERTRFVVVVVVAVVAISCQIVLAEKPDLPSSNEIPPKEESSQEVSVDVAPSAPSAIAWNRFTILATAATTVVVIAGILATVALFFPLLAYKVCYLVGSCDYSLYSYVDKFVANPRQKRAAAIEYLGPLLQTLAAAYEKYGEPDVKKKLETLSFFER